MAILDRLYYLCCICSGDVGLAELGWAALLVGGLGCEWNKGEMGGGMIEIAWTGKEMNVARTMRTDFLCRWWVRFPVLLLQGKLCGCGVEYLV